MNRPEMVGKLGQDGSYHHWMVDELAKGNVCSLEAWCQCYKRFSGAPGRKPGGVYHETFCGRE
jgi:hypothetical protein